MYDRLQLKLINGATATIKVDQSFTVKDLVYHRRRRAVSLGNLTVLYEGMVYDVHPSRQPSERRSALA